MNASRTESYRANNCAGMALFFEEGLRSGCDQYAPEFSHKAVASGVMYHLGGYHELTVRRTRTSVGWTQSARADYQVTLKSADGMARTMSFSSDTSPSDLDRELITDLSDMFPDLPVPAELI